MASGQPPRQPPALAGAATTTPATALTAFDTSIAHLGAAAAASPAASSNASLTMPSASEIANDCQSHNMAMHRNLQLLVQRDALLARHLRQSEEARKQQAEQLSGDLARSEVLRKHAEECLQEATRREFTAQQRVRALEQQLAEAEWKLQHAGMQVELDSACENAVDVDNSAQQTGLGTENGSAPPAETENDTQMARQAVQQLLELYAVLQKLIDGFCDGFSATMEALAQEYPKFSPEYWLPATDMKYMRWLRAFRLDSQQAKSRGNKAHTTGGQAHCQHLSEGRNTEQHTHPATAEASMQAKSRDAAVQTILDTNQLSKALVQLRVHLREQEQLKQTQPQVQQRLAQQRQALLLPKPPGAPAAEPSHAQPSSVRPTMQPASPPPLAGNTRLEFGGSLQPTDAPLTHYQQYCSLQDTTAPQSPAEVADAIALAECLQQDGTHAPSVILDTELEDGEIGKQHSCEPPVPATEGRQPEPVLAEVAEISSRANQEELAAAVHVKQEYQSESAVEGREVAETKAKMKNPTNNGCKDVVSLSSSSDSEGSDGLDSSASARKRPRAW
eukprot:jgi/Chlat1/7138/Chrsp57S06742